MNGSNPSILPGSSLQPSRLDGGLRRARRSLSALSFWGAIALPSVYLPLLLAGLETAGGLATFLLLFGLHAFALVGGRRYRRANDR